MIGSSNPWLVKSVLLEKCVKAWQLNHFLRLTVFWATRDLTANTFPPVKNLTDIIYDLIRWRVFLGDLSYLSSPGVTEGGKIVIYE